MPKKPSLAQRNAALIEDIVKKKAKDSKGKPLPIDVKYVIAENMRIEANNKKKLITDIYDNLQEAYNKSHVYYDGFVINGLKGIPLYLGTLKKKALLPDTTLHIIEHGKTKKVEPAEFIYKAYDLAQTLSLDHNVAITQFAPMYKFKGKIVDITIDIPELDEEELQEMTVEEIVEYFADYGIEIVISDPRKAKDPNKQAEWDAAKAKHQKTLKTITSKYRKQLKQAKKK